MSTSAILSPNPPNDLAQGDLEHSYNSAPFALVWLNAEGNIIRVNQTFCMWSGFSLENALGKALLTFVAVADDNLENRADVPQEPDRTIAKGSLFYLLTPAGRSLRVLANSTVLTNDNGEFLSTEILLMRADGGPALLAELAQALNAERQAVNRLEARIVALERQIEQAVTERTEVRKYAELQEQFIAVLGHDLRNPVAAIDSGAAILLREGWTIRAPLILKLMRNSVVRMNGLINNVLDLTRFRLGGGINLNLEPGRPLAPTLQQVIEEIRTAHPVRAIHDRIEVHVNVSVDHLRIAQAYSNLLGNALKHGAPEGPIYTECRVSEGMLEIIVRNSGNPIPPDMMERLFKPFHRGQEHHNSGGLGLGLYIAAQIADAHDGTIAVNSDELETCFSLRIPFDHVVPSDHSDGES